LLKPEHAFHLLIKDSGLFTINKIKIDVTNFKNGYLLGMKALVIFKNNDF